MVNTRSATRNQPSRLTPSVMARRQRNSPQPIQNLPFHHRYDNPPERLSDTPRLSPTQASHRNSGNSVDPDSGPPDNDGHNDGHNYGHNSNSGSVHTPVPEPESKPKPEDTSKVLVKALTQLVEFVDPDRQVAPRVMVKEPDQFNGSDQWKFRGFLLQLKLNF